MVKGTEYLTNNPTGFSPSAAICCCRSQEAESSHCLPSRLCWKEGSSSTVNWRAALLLDAASPWSSVQTPLPQELVRHGLGNTLPVLLSRLQWAHSLIICHEPSGVLKMKSSERQVLRSSSLCVSIYLIWRNVNVAWHRKEWSERHGISVLEKKGGRKGKVIFGYTWKDCLALWESGLFLWLTLELRMPPTQAKITHFSSGPQIWIPSYLCSQDHMRKQKSQSWHLHLS